MSIGMKASPEKQQAQRMALAWWQSTIGRKREAKGYARCTICLGKIPTGDGYLCTPMLVVGTTSHGSPELACETCFDDNHLKPWNLELATEASKNKVAAQKPKKFWEFWAKK